MRFLLCFWPLITFPCFGCIEGPISGTDLKTGKDFTFQPQNLVVLFLSSQCPCSKSHESVLDHLQKEFTEMKFVAIHSNKEESGAEEHFKKSNLQFPVLQDKESEWANRFHALKTPHAFIIGAKGQCWFNGGVDDSKDAAQAKEHYLKRALLELRQGKEPSQKTARTLGCIIRR